MTRIGYAMILVVIVAGALWPGDAQAVRVGPNLSQNPPNWDFDCRTWPAVFGPTATGVTDCTYVNAAMATPQGGAVATQVRVRTGPTTGPMRMTVARQIGTVESGIGCCFPAGESQTFTPRPNSITAVNIRVPVDSFTDGVNGVQIADYMGLSGLRIGAPVPGVAYRGHISGGIFPKLRQSDQSGRTQAGLEFLPTFTVELTPLCGRGRTSARPAEVRAARAIAGTAAPLDPGPQRVSAGVANNHCVGGVTPRSGRLSSSSASVPLLCNLTGRCRGRLILRSARGGSKLGSSSFRVNPGRRKSVKVKLNSAGRRAARGKRSLRVKVTAKVKGGPNAAGKVRLKR